MKLELNKIKPNDSNPRYIKNDAMESLIKSIKEFPEMLEVRPIVVNKDYLILGGNMRFKAAQKAGVKEIDVTVVDWPEDKQREFIIKDNVSGGEWDWDLLANEWDTELLQDWGLKLPDGLGEDEEIEEDEAPEVDEGGALSLKGEVYLLGRHKVMCGDSTNKDDINKLFDQDKAKLIFTSPPYNMDGGMYETYEDNLARQEYIEFNLNVVNIWKKYLKGFVFWNISYNKNARDEFIEILYRIINETGLKFLELIVWNKKTAMPIISKDGLTRQYEDILAVGDEDSLKEDFEMNAILRNNKQSFFNIKTRKWLRNYWEISPVNSQLDNHKACYPVNLPARAIRIMTVNNEIVADPFLGSGSTLIACEQTGRICYGMELDPKYVDVIRKRYAKLKDPDNWEATWETMTPILK